MNVYLDSTIYYLQKFGGISVYWNELSNYLSSHRNIKLRFIESNYNPKLFNDSLHIKRHQVHYDRKLPIQLLRYLPIRLKEVDKNSILHSSYFRFSRNKRVKNICTVYDFTYEFHFKGLSSKIHHYQKKIALKKASGIICISDNTKNDLLSLYPNLIDKPIKVIYLAASDSFRPLSEINIAKTRFSELKNKKIISFVGKRVPYKNFSLAVDIINNLPQDYHLVIIGGGELNNNELEILSKSNGRFTHYNIVNQEELNKLYNISFCFLYPSLYEGFGIPILESMQAGCPVICQSISSIPEVYGDVENLVTNINSLDEFCNNILKLEDKEYRQRIITQGFKNASSFNWNKTAERTYDFYQEIIAL